MELHWIKKFVKLVKFEHTLFALPFAYIGLLLAPGEGKILIFVWVTIAMVSARTAGMALNRIIDLKYDKLNPRTQDRILSRGDMHGMTVVAIIIVSILVFECSSYMLNRLCFVLSPVALALLFIYSYLKRFTWVGHIVLGAILACAPVGGWLAVTGSFSFSILVLGFAVILWVAGFDILYACGDYDFDREHDLRSIPIRFGIEESLLISSACHFMMTFLLFLIGFTLDLGIFYFLGVTICSLLLIYEHMLLKKDRVKNMSTAFFTVNAWISVILLVFTIADKIAY
ncbi:MAG: UbiA-like polyprenyltransferase [Candidatus Ancaeobacter aquaticus]|nr:UbiA-like polyprenyltransferase [Candidatus Ancaeobacter aquaticus]